MKPVGIRHDQRPALDAAFCQKSCINCGPTRARARRRNIADHYDLGNDFYELWLDPGDDLLLRRDFRYAASNSRTPSLEGGAAGARCGGSANSCKLAPGKKLLEIGCGWGGFAELAAARIWRGGGCHHPFARAVEPTRRSAHRASRAQLVKSHVKLQDYRDVQRRASTPSPRLK